MTTKKTVTEIPVVSQADIDDLRAQVLSIQNLVEVTHKGLDVLTTRFNELVENTPDTDNQSDEYKVQVMWDYIQRFNTLLNSGRITNTVDGSAEIALNEILGDDA
ncbi:hypothetical protein CMI37_24965 [Candidatus Pacearchaeota archaeon]|nr:hypothetical protein [Candidatus Pacearchaeota archaeon]|tara:strand:- start:883 stop:1197 length:315 start_codon:yes stop_codon:yes gene_type:complete